MKRPTEVEKRVTSDSSHIAQCYVVFQMLFDEIDRIANMVEMVHHPFLSIASSLGYLCVHAGVFTLFVVLRRNTPLHPMEDRIAFGVTVWPQACARDRVAENHPYE